MLGLLNSVRILVNGTSTILLELTVNILAQIMLYFPITVLERTF